MTKMNNEVSIEKEAEVAAEWWKNNIGSGAKHDNGDLFQSLFMQMLSANYQIPDSKKEEFKEALKTAIIQEYESRGRLYGRVQLSFEKNCPEVYLSVDYDPDELLFAVARESGLSGRIFPVKTKMLIRQGSVKVSAGYGKDFEEIFEGSDKQGKKPSQPGDEE